MSREGPDPRRSRRRQRRQGTQALAGLFFSVLVLCAAVILSRAFQPAGENGAASEEAAEPAEETAVMGFLDTEGAAPASGETISPDLVRARLDELKIRFPDGKYWNHMGCEEWDRNTVTDIPCCHSAYGEAFCNSYRGATGELFPMYQDPIQCLGFASMLSDEIFGKDAPVSVHRSYDRLQIGDQIRLTEEEHSMVVIQKNEDEVQVAEVNADYQTCRICWGRVLTREELERCGEQLEYLTRYPAERPARPVPADPEAE